MAIAKHWARTCGYDGYIYAFTVDKDRNKYKHDMYNKKEVPEATR